jgi:hypothetical protein
MVFALQTPLRCDGFQITPLRAQFSPISVLRGSLQELRPLSPSTLPLQRGVAAPKLFNLLPLYLSFHCPYSVLRAICLLHRNVLRFFQRMTTHSFLPCDGCGQSACSGHLERRLQRLEWSTRYRPLHINTVLLSAFAPEKDTAFLYSERTPLEGEAALLLEAVQIPFDGNPPGRFLNEFQKRGLFLMHVLACPLDPPNLSAAAALALLGAHLPLAITRIRRSLKPRRVALLAAELLPFAGELTESSLGCPVLLHLEKLFEIMKRGGTAEVAAFRLALEGARSSVR